MAWACRSRHGGLGFAVRAAWVSILPVGCSGFCRLGFLGFAAWVSVHGVVVVNGLGLGLGSPRGGWVFWFLPVGFFGFCRLSFGARRGGG